ncbi:MAG: DUF2589 domain-containing protein [Ruminiclostridium sp.]|nr:DUF2589 domain-containing protein [Ruminiclostridium sp.]
MELEAFIKTIGSSIQQARKAIEYNSVCSFFNQYFSSETIEDSNGEKKWVPKIENVSVSRPDGKKIKMTVPVMALVNHSTMELDQVKIKVKIKVSTDQNSEKINVDVEGIENDQGGGAQNELEFTFNRNVASEGISRINQQAINII